MTYSNELQRKSIHLFSLSIPIGYYFLSKTVMLQILIPTLILGFVLDTLRLFYKPAGLLIHRWFGHMLRQHEIRYFCGATFLVLGAVLTIFFLDRLIAVAVLSFLIISDTFASLVGKRWGKWKLSNKKTIEGSLAFLFSALLVAYTIPNLDIRLGIIGAVSATIIELFSFKFDDNLTIPIGAGIMMQLSSLLMS